MMGSNVALLIYSDPLHFPPTINAANILSENGKGVHLVGFDNKDNWSQQLNVSVKFTSLGPSKTGWRSVTAYFKSIFFLRRYLRKNQISWLISYDAKSVLPSFIATRFRKTKWIYHQHDFWEHPAGVWEKFLWRCERRLARYADHISFPQVQRAAFFKKVAKLKEDPLILFNGPRKKWIELTTEVNTVVQQFRSQFTYILIYQGGWSKYFALERLFDAMAVCKASVALIMLGEERETGLRENYLQYLKNLGITDRVYLAEKYIPYEELPGFTKYCDAAIGKLTGDIDDAPFNDRYLIGAANKITEYIACGLPVILQDSEANQIFLEQYPVGILTNTAAKNEFSGTIDELLNDQPGLDQFKQRNKDIFLRELNFDQQFQKILDIINDDGMDNK